MDEPKITRWLYDDDGNITAVDVEYKGFGQMFYPQSEIREKYKDYIMRGVYVIPEEDL